MKNLLLALMIALLSCACTKDEGGGDSGGGDDVGDGTSNQLTGACVISRITNGVHCPGDAGPVALINLYDSENQLFGVCSGAFISKSHVLTAGHCAAGASQFGARLEVYTGGLTAGVRNFSIHPNYDVDGSTLSPFDSAVLVLDRELNVPTLPLLLSEPVNEGAKLNVLGYGKDEMGLSALDQSPEDSIKKADMIVLSLEQGFIISSFNTLQQSACEGDSGGPALLLNRDNFAGIVGIVNGGTSTDCLAGTTAFFTNVQRDSIRDFILSVVPNAKVI